ncbi:hypothetical protein BELL_0024g00310 [Botrytis elliptica]|uniref:Ubiquinone biosynthesis O-methyltransferase, mitochondrial n=1 Tax=Botrytis elliptica TaxID=278938 RepID=A0A4Z1K871_9HELO|nr:hypothetical protein EAE99_007585 [Botrytis elliptica]TGO79752.1 hypothetical protein BELL_0024g00310 [Botrytis elliptica]
MPLTLSTPLRPTSLRNINLLLRTAPRYVQNQFRSQSTSPNHSHSSSSVNPNEVSHFNALASTWWDPHGSSRLLHLMNPLRHDFIRTCHSSQPIPPASSGLKYLDIGCGGGIFAESAARLGNSGSVTAIDPSPVVLNVAKAHARKDPGLQGKLTYLNTSIEGLPRPTSREEQYDVLSLFEVIEHITYPSEFLDKCTPFVKPGGWIIMSTMARTWTSWLTTKVVAEDVMGIVPRGTHDWNQYINEEELRGHFLRERGWNSPIVRGVVYVPGLGWKVVPGSEKVGNYFFGIRRDEVTQV